MEQKPVVSTNMGPSVQYCCILLEQLKKHLCVLYQEAHLLRNMEEEFTHRKNAFNECSGSINNKLLYLWALSDQHPQDSSKKNLRNFLVQLTKNWKDTEDKIALESVSVPVFSRTSTNVLLPAILEKTQYIAESTKFTFQTITAHFVCSRHAAYLYNEIMCAIARLSTYVAGAHYSLLLSKLLPYLEKLNASLEAVAKAGSSDGVQPPPGPSTAPGDAGGEDREPTELSGEGDSGCISIPAAPVNRDPMYTVDGKVAPSVKRVLRPLAPFGSSRTAPAAAHARTAHTVNIKTEPPDPDAAALSPHGTSAHRPAADGSEDECDLLPIKMPRLESGLLAPLP